MSLDLQLVLAAAGALVLGAVVGSFLNVVIHRGPVLWGLVDAEPRGGLARPRSYCPACGKPIPAARLIPIVSFLLQKGRCAACGARIEMRYPAVEALGGLAALAALGVFGVSSTALAAAAFGWALIALAYIDFEIGFLPDAITLPLIAVGLGANAFGLFAPFADAAIGAAAGYLAFRAIEIAFAKLRKKEGLGEGDAKLLAAIGAWAGWMILPFVVLVAAAGTLLVVLASSARGVLRDAEFRSAPQAEESLSPENPAPGEGVVKGGAPVPFGPGLCAAGYLVLLFWPRLSGL